jgi:P27 family predicted phage terminase small subunit
MGRGRPPKPSALKELEGNRGRRELTPDLPLAGTPDCPEMLDAVGAEHFERIKTELVAVGVVKRLDGEAMAMLCEAWSDFWMASEAMRTADNVEESKEARMLKYTAFKAWVVLAARFGLTPADRQKIIAGSGQKKTDEVEERFLKIRA